MAQFADAVNDQDKVVSALTHVEGNSAICRLRKGKFLNPPEASSAMTLLANDLAKVTEQPVNHQVIHTASAMSDRYSLRAMDAIQLGSAIVARDLLAAPDMRFIASDKELLEAAQAEGFDVWDPAT